MRPTPRGRSRKLRRTPVARRKPMRMLRQPFLTGFRFQITYPMAQSPPQRIECVNQLKPGSSMPLHPVWQREMVPDLAISRIWSPSSLHLLGLAPHFVSLISSRMASKFIHSRIYHGQGLPRPWSRGTPRGG